MKWLNLRFMSVTTGMIEMFFDFDCFPYPYKFYGES